MKRCIACLVALGAAASGSPAQDLALERSRVLAVAGTATGVDRPLFPVADEAGVIFRQPVVEPGAESIRLHFAVLAPDPEGPSWAIRLLDASGAEVWTTWAGEGEAAFWSDEVEGERVTVELVSLRPESPVRIRIDRIAVGDTPSVPVSIVGVDQLSPIGAQDPWIRELGRSVARIRYVGDEGKLYSCTGFLVTTELMFTNQHCLATATEADSALVEFDFDQATVGEKRRVRALLAVDFGLDYALVRLKRPLERPGLRLDATGVAVGAGLAVIQHPGGRPKQVAVADCRVDRTPVTGRGGAATDFGHVCDTLGGSSGAPVLAFDRRTVVGLHHLGFESDDALLVNRAVDLARILADLDPALRAEIEAGQPPAPNP